MTVQELINKLSELGALQCELLVYDTNGNQLKIVDVYIPEDDVDNLVCIDVERVKEKVVNT